MPISYLFDSNGDMIAVQIPKGEWCELIEKHPDIEAGQQVFEIPEGQKEEVLRRKKYYERNDGELLSWEEAKRRLKLE